MGCAPTPPRHVLFVPGETDSSGVALFNEVLRQAEREHMEEVERHILSGDNEFWVDNVLWKVNPWRRDPLGRLRIEWRRFWYRQGQG